VTGGSAAAAASTKLSRLAKAADKVVPDSVVAGARKADYDNWGGEFLDNGIRSTPQPPTPNPTRLTDTADRIRTSGGHPAARNQRTIAVGEDGAGNLYAGFSNGCDAGQRAALETEGFGGFQAVVLFTPRRSCCVVCQTSSVLEPQSGRLVGPPNTIVSNN